MTDDDLPALTVSQKVWAGAAALLFLTAVGFLGYAFAEGAMMTFAVGWVVLQVFGFVGSLRMAKGDFAHPLFKSQVILHVIAITLLIALLVRGG